MSKDKLILLALSFCAVITIVLFYVLVLNRTEKTKNKIVGVVKPSKDGIIPYTWYLKADKFLKGNVISRIGYRKIVNRINSLSVFTKVEADKKAVQLYVISNVLFAAVIIGAAIGFKDVYSVCVFIMLGVVVKHTFVFKQLDKLEFSMFEELSEAISALRLAYLRYDENIPDALQQAEVPHLLGNMFEEIVTVLASQNPEEQLELFYESCSLRKMQTLASVCYLLADIGDTRDNNNMSNFVSALAMIREEVNLDIRRVNLQHKKFKSLEYLTVVPLPLMSIMEIYMTKFIPEIGVIYKSSLGYFSKVLIVLLGTGGYLAIAHINSVYGVKKDDRTLFIYQLLNIRWFRRFVLYMTPVRTDGIIKWRKKIDYAISQKTTEEIYALKFMYSVVVFILCIITTIAICFFARHSVYNNYGGMGLSGTKAVKEVVHEARLKWDPVYMASKSLPSEETTTDFVKEHYKVTGLLETEEEVERLQKKYKYYYGASFKWWMMLIIEVLMALAWFEPDLQLHFRSKIVRYEAEEDILQLQTLITILMNTPMDTMECIYWLAMQSQVYKEMLLECFHDYAGDPELALGRLKSKTFSMPELYRIIDKLELTAYQVSLKEAFADLPAERGHTMSMREVSQESSIISKRNICSPISLMPLGAILFFYLFLPMGMLGFSQLIDSLSKAGM